MLAIIYEQGLKNCLAMEVLTMTEIRLKPSVRIRISTFLSIVAICLAAQARAQAQPQPAPPSQKKEISISASVMDPKNVADIFGRRVAKRYVAVQLTIANRSPDFQYLIHDVRLAVNDVYLDASLKPKKDYKPTSEDLLMVRGVAEKGQIYDPSNFILRLLRGTGNIAAGVIGVASLGASYAPTVAMFNGPVLTAYRDVFPDMTINQMNRLNDTAYAANSLVPKQSSKVLVAFLPQAILMDAKYQGKFWKDPLSIVQQIDFRNLKPIVDGSFMTVVEEKTEEKPAEKPEEKAATTRSNEGSSADPAVTDRVAPPTLASLDKTEVAKGETFNLVLTGTNFLPGDDKTQVLITPDDRINGDLAVQVTSKNIKSATSIELAVRIADRASLKEYEIRVITPGGISNPQKLRVSTPMGANE